MGRLLRIDWHEKDMPDALKEAHPSEKDTEVQARLHLLWLVRDGVHITTAAAVFIRIHHRSTQRWIEWYRRGGLAEALSRMVSRGF